MNNNHEEVEDEYLSFQYMYLLSLGNLKPKIRKFTIKYIK